MRKVHTKGAMRQCGCDRVFEVVDAIATVFATVTIVDPCVRVLVHEQGHADGREVSVSFVTITIAPQRVPGRRRDRMSWRGDREHVEDRVFAIRVPTWF